MEVAGLTPRARPTGHDPWDQTGDEAKAREALLGGVAAIVCVGAPTSLAVSLAAETHLTLVGFARGGDRYNVYVGAVTAGQDAVTAGVPPSDGT